MNDTNKPNEQTPAADDWAARAKAHEERRQAAFAANRAALFDALERGGIETVTVIFDGYGDSGQIEDVEVTGGAPDALAGTKIEQKQVLYGKDVIETVAVPLQTAIEDLCYDLLASTHAGWCNNEGASGEFVFDVPARAITLDFNERYVSTESYSHEF